MMINKNDLLKSLISDLETMKKEDMIRSLDEYGVEFELDKSKDINMINMGSIEDNAIKMFSFKKTFSNESNLYINTLKSNEYVTLINEKEYNKFYGEVA
ncbi:hypothetical protein [Clostridium nigeriense]|uniref:hypothetical protein n=1 Tax=Clostridium nigeriense TaxID=1805470 RepID=UPI00082C993B|nr:hypothetical protein [Clostridium nigeriense]